MIQKMKDSEINHYIKLRIICRFKSCTECIRWSAPISRRKGSEIRKNQENFRGAFVDIKRNTPTSKKKVKYQRRGTRFLTCLETFSG